MIPQSHTEAALAAFLNVNVATIRDSPNCMTVLRAMERALLAFEDARRPKPVIEGRWFELGEFPTEGNP